MACVSPTKQCFSTQHVAVFRIPVQIMIACVCTFLFLQAEIFLNLLSQFKELGFPEEKIFDALKKSEGDSNKTLDILTCAR